MVGCLSFYHQYTHAFPTQNSRPLTYSLHLLALLLLWMMRTSRLPHRTARSGSAAATAVLASLDQGQKRRNTRISAHSAAARARAAASAYLCSLCRPLSRPESPLWSLVPGILENLGQIWCSVFFAAQPCLPAKVRKVKCWLSGPSEPLADQLAEKGRWLKPALNRLRPVGTRVRSEEGGMYVLPFCGIWSGYASDCTG